MTQINLQAHTEEQSGYGRMGARLSAALERLGVESAGDIGLVPQGIARRERLAPVDLARVALWLSTPPHVRGWYEGQFAAIFTMWESTEIPPGFRHNLHHFDRIIVPSVQNLELYRRFHDDVRLVPLGIDPSWSWRPRPAVRNEFRFLTAGYGTRKGCAQVARAFAAAFPKGLAPDKLGPAPKLIVRSRDDVHGPGISTIPANLSMKAELDLYGNAHCFVSGSKGEGFGFMPLQAIAQGLPTILGDAHGHHAYAHYGIPLDVHPYSAKGATFWGDGGEWWEPDFDQMVESMRDVYANYAWHTERAGVNALAAAKEFTWEASAEALILELADQLYLPAPTERVWKGAPPRLFHVRVNKRCAYTVNGIVNAFEPGIDYYEAADLKRAVIASGHLDMSTWDPHDLGLEDSPDLGMLRAQNSICPTCKQRYNTDQSVMDWIAAP